jgi:uncharacterized protein (DUF2384 family)
MLELKKNFKPDPVPIRQPHPVVSIYQPALSIHQPVLPIPSLKEDSCFGDSKTLRTFEHRKMIIKFVQDQFPKARFQKIYDAATDGWGANDFHR